MKKRVLQVNIHAREASVVDLTVAERVQLDRLVRSPNGCVAERHGPLLDPGMTTIALEQGHYLFRTLSDASLHVVRGGVDTVVVPHGDKQGGPIELGLKGDESEGELPCLTIEPPDA